MSTVTVPKGYKRTEVGVIPEEWEVTPLGQLSEVKMCKRIFSHQTSPVGEIPFFKIGTFGGTPDAFISANLYKSFRQKYSFPQKGDVLISAAGTLGKTVIYDGCDAYFQDSNIVWLDTDKAQILNQYLFHCYKVMKWESPEGSTISRLYNGIIKATCIPLPSSLHEQEVIAAALSDADALIESLEQLLAKKRQIKQGAMQELLTGKRRLPGFTGKWVIKRLDELANIVMGQSPSSANYNSEGYGTPLIQGNADVSNRKTIKRVFTTEITKSGNKGDILISVRAPVGEISIATFDVCLGRGVCALQNTNDYLYHALIAVEPDWAKLSKGSTFDSVTSTDVKSFCVSLPSDSTEQTAIAAVLSDMDTELEALEGKLDKARQVKQGMMQQLLTGKVRLV